MTNVEFYIIDIDNNRTNFVNNTTLTPRQSLVIQPKKTTNYNIFIEIFNPFNLIVFSHWFKRNKAGSIRFNFSENMASGLYYIKIQNITIYNNTKDVEDKNSFIQYFSINFVGKFQNKEWLLTYAIQCNNIPGLDIRIAIPKENFPFCMIDSFEGKPVETITTDVWSSWLVLESNSVQNNLIKLGYRSWISINYIFFTPQSLLDNEKSSEDLKKYLEHEEGIESEYIHIVDFSKRIRAVSTLGIVHQILSLVSSHLRFENQPGEFGAKFALLNKQGDCTEFSALFVALCRVKNIPSRLVAGLKLESSTNTWIRHAWAEFYYKGLWIPVDVVEGFIIGFTPEIIPLFKGNWMTEGMAREIKISVQPEFENQITHEQIVDVFKSLQISFKVYSKSNAPIPVPTSSEIRSIHSFPFNFVETQSKNTEYALNFSTPFTNQKGILFCYYQCISENFPHHPKIVYHISYLKISDVDTKIQVLSPEFPSYYEQGIFITTLYGQVLLWEKKRVLVD